jgi:nicotinamidase-related amidase
MGETLLLTFNCIILLVHFIYFFFYFNNMESKCETLLDKVGIKKTPSTLKDSTLVMIDIQNEYLPSGNVPLEGVEQAIEENKKLLDRARENGTPVVHVVHHGPPGKGFYDPEGEGGQTCTSVKPLDSETLIKKNYISSFVNTNLEEELKKTGKNNLIVTGFMTHMCLTTTVRDAAEKYGYNCTIVANCTGTRDLPSKNENGEPTKVKAKDVQNANLAALADYFACVVDKVEDIKDE